MKQPRMHRTVYRACVGLGIVLFASIASVLFSTLFQVNQAVLELRYVPAALGVSLDINEINNTLKSISYIPRIIGVGDASGKETVSVVITGTNGSIGRIQNRIIETIPQWLILPIDMRPYPVIMSRNTLIFTRMDKEVLVTVSPTLARLLLHAYFPARNLKSDPTILSVNRSEYLVFRKDQITRQVANIDADTRKVQDFVGVVSRDISLSEQQTEEARQGLQSSTASQTAEFNDCVASGYNDEVTGEFSRNNSDETCRSRASRWDPVLAGYQKNLTDILAHWRNDLWLADQAQRSIATLIGYKQLVNAQMDTTSRELGMFTDPSTIRIVLDTTNAKTTNVYLETLVHESLHYQSFVSVDKRLGTAFFEEGLTEYFTRQVLSRDLGMDVNIGYPLFTKIITQMMHKIPEKEFEQIYLTKDEARLEAVLNNAFGSTFYTDNEMYFTLLSYEPPAETLKMANTIMMQIGGSVLTQKDLFSADLPIH